MRPGYDVRQGKIITANADGSYDIRLTGQDTLIKGVGATSGVGLQVNSIVEVAYIDADSQKPFILNQQAHPYVKNKKTIINKTNIWAQEGKDSFNSSYNGSLFSCSGGVYEWQYNSTNGESIVLQIKGDNEYILIAEPTVIVCLDTSGNISWQRTLTLPIAGTPYSQHICLFGGKIYVFRGIFEVNNVKIVKNILNEDGYEELVTYDVVSFSDMTGSGAMSAQDFIVKFTDYHDSSPRFFQNFIRNTVDYTGLVPIGYSKSKFYTNEGVSTSDYLVSRYNLYAPFNQGDKAIYNDCGYIFAYKKFTGIYGESFFKNLSIYMDAQGETPWQYDETSYPWLPELHILKISLNSFSENICLLDHSPNSYWYYRSFREHPDGGTVWNTYYEEIASINNPGKIFVSDDNGVENIFVIVTLDERSKIYNIDYYGNEGTYNGYVKQSGETWAKVYNYSSDFQKRFEKSFIQTKFDNNEIYNDYIPPDKNLPYYEYSHTWTDYYDKVYEKFYPFCVAKYKDIGWLCSYIRYQHAPASPAVYTSKIQMISIYGEIIEIDITSIYCGDSPVGMIVDSACSFILWTATTIYGITFAGVKTFEKALTATSIIAGQDGVYAINISYGRVYKL